MAYLKELRHRVCDDCFESGTDELFSREGKSLGVYCLPHAAQRKVDIDKFEAKELVKA